VFQLSLVVFCILCCNNYCIAKATIYDDLQTSTDRLRTACSITVMKEL